MLNFRRSVLLQMFKSGEIKEVRRIHREIYLREIKRILFPVLLAKQLNFSAFKLFGIQRT